MRRNCVSLVLQGHLRLFIKRRVLGAKMAGFSYVSVDRVLLFDVFFLVVFRGIHGVQRFDCSRLLRI